MTNWTKVLLVFIFSAVLATVAFFYKPPELAYIQMQQTMAEQPNWNMHVQGEVGEEIFQMDLTNNSSGSFVRVSYPLAKIINNQWIELDALDIFSIFYFNKRLFPVKHDGLWYDRYAFIAPVEVMDFFPNLTSMRGEVWFPFKISWPWQRPAMLPSQGKMVVSLAQLEFSMAYDDLLKDNVQSRPLADVLAQLESDELPKVLIPLAAGASDTQAFFHDFDYDGLSDALEVFYGTDPANPDTDNDTFLDGEEVEQGYNPVD